MQVYPFVNKTQQNPVGKCEFQTKYNNIYIIDSTCRAYRININKTVVHDKKYCKRSTGNMMLYTCHGSKFYQSGIYSYILHTEVTKRKMIYVHFL